MTEREYVVIDGTFWLDVAFLILTAVLFGRTIAKSGASLGTGEGVIEKVLF